jgi:proteasome lid subunit RPN8/RPN11
VTTVRQRNAKQGPPPPLQIGKPFPDDQSILWKPADALARAPELATPAVVISQGALREVIRHLSSSPDQELLGFLIGEQCECPRSKLRYLFITGTLRTGHTIAEEEPVQIPDAEWLGQQLEVRRRRSTLIGWYHSTPFLSPSPSSLDVASHRARFTEPWQCGLIIATEGNEPAGGLFRVHADPAAGGAYIPFYEHVEQDGMIEGGRFRTLIDWTTYTTKELVERDEDERSVHLSGSSRRADSDSDSDANAPPSTLPLMIPSPSMEDVPRPARSRWVPFGIAVAIVLVATLITMKVWDFRRLPEPPMALSPNRPREAVVVPPAAPSRTDSVPPTTTAAPPGAVAGGPVTMPDTTTVATTTAPPAPMTAPIATPRAPTVSAPVPSEIRMAAQANFDSLADSLEHSLHNYQDRRTDFAAKRLSCKELAYGYRAADEALVGLAKLAGDTRGLDAQRKSRYNGLIAGMDTVNNDFVGSTCKRL